MTPELASASKAEAPAAKSTGGLTRHALALAVLMALLAGQVAWFCGTKGLTYDELLFFNAARLNLLTGEPYGFAVLNASPLPGVLAHTIPAMQSETTLVEPEDVWYPHAADRPLALQSRWWHLVLIAWPLVIIGYVWLARRRGWAAATAGGLLLVTSPMIVAHSGIAATDVCFVTASLLGLAALASHLRSRTWWSYALFGGALGVALASKPSAVFLIPTAALLLLAYPPPGRTGTSPGFFWRLIGLGFHFVGLGLLAFLTNWACTGFAFGPATAYENSPLLEGPLKTLLAEWRPVVFDSWMFLLLHNREGHPAYLAGEISLTGWWYYFPYAWTMKSTPAEWLLACLAGLASLRLLLTSWTRTDRDPTPWMWLLGGSCLLLLAMQARINIGVRHILLLWPLLVLFSIDQLAEVARRWKWRWLLPAVAVLAMTLQAGSAWSVAPHYLAYFNPAYGGPTRGPEWLVDSNLDWGQDLPLLAAELDRLESERTTLSYFGTDPLLDDDPQVIPWEDVTISDLPKIDTVAISATNLYGSYLPGDPFRPFRTLTPDARAGYSILIYRVDRPDVQQALLEAYRRRR